MRAPIATTYQSHQLIVIAAVMFGSIVTAVVASTFIVMSLMRSEMAHALSAYTPAETTAAAAPIVQQPGTCVAPVETTAAEPADPAPAAAAPTWTPSTYTWPPRVTKSHSTSVTNITHNETHTTSTVTNSIVTVNNDNDVTVGDNAVAIIAGNSSNTTVTDNDTAVTAGGDVAGADPGDTTTTNINSSVIGDIAVNITILPPISD